MRDTFFSAQYPQLQWISSAPFYHSATNERVYLSSKKKNFIKPQYNNAINTQHCGRLPDKTNVHHAGHLNKKNKCAHTHTHTHTEKEINYEHKTTKKERKDRKITQQMNNVK